MDKNRICFIRAKLKKDYVFDGIKASGYGVIIPYKDSNLFLRLCREAWTRMGLPKGSIWFNQEVERINQDIIIVKDPLISPDFMRFLREHHPTGYIILDYDNRVARSLNPENIREYVDEIWSYDQEDCTKYGLRKKGEAYLDVYQTIPNPVSDYDVFYVGRDKGRLDALHDVERKLNEQGLKTFFYICADREFLTWKKKEYKHFLPYEGYLELLKRSRAILNIVPEGQKSITQREMEVVFDGVKCITNNKGILDFELYDDSRYYLLDNNYEGIPDFLNKPFNSVSDSELDKYRFANHIDEMLREKK